MRNPFKKDKPLSYTNIHQHDLGGFRLRLDEANKNKKGAALLEAYRQKKFADRLGAVHIGTLDGKEAAEQPSFEGWLLQLFNDGFYKVTVMDRDNRSHGDFFFAVGNPKEEKEDKEKTRIEGTATNTYVAGLLDIVKTVMAAQMAGGNGEMYEKAFDRMDKQFDRMLGFVSTGNDPYEQAERLINISKSLQPQINPEDSTMAALTTIATGLMNMARGGSEITPAHLSQFLAQHDLTLTPSQPNALPPGVQPQQNLASAAQTSQHQGQFVLGTGPAQPQPQPTLSGAIETKPQTTGIDPEHQSFYSMYIDKFRRSVSAGASDYTLAEVLIDMVEYTDKYMRDNPHPQMVAIAPAFRDKNLAVLNTEVEKFLDSIPELAGKKDRHLAIMQMAYNIYYTGGEDEQDQPDDGSGNDDDEGDEG